MIAAPLPRPGLLIRLTVLLSLLILTGLAGPSQSQSVSSEFVQFPRGKDEVSVSHRIRGENQWLYVVSGRKGQRLRIVMESSNPQAWFNVSGTGTIGALHNGAITGNRFDVTLPATDDYQVLVYLTRDAARRNERAENVLTFRLQDAEPPPKPAKPGPDAVKPEFWQVYGLKSGTSLPVRVVPLNVGTVVGEVQSGDLVRNLGCQGSGNNRWCEVELKAAKKPRGWIWAIYLRVPEDGKAGLPAGNGKTFDATGSLTCDLPGRKTADCAYGIIYGKVPGTARLWVAIGPDRQRLIRFQDGVPVETDGGGLIGFDLKGRMLDITIGRETYRMKQSLISAE